MELNSFRIGTWLKIGNTFIKIMNTNAYPFSYFFAFNDNLYFFFFWNVMIV